MAVLRGILLFVFFGALVWLAVSQGMKQEAGMAVALAAEQDVETPARADLSQVVETFPADELTDPGIDLDASYGDVPYGDGSAAEVPVESYSEQESGTDDESLDDERPEWLTMEPEPVPEPEPEAEVPATTEQRSLDLQRPTRSGAVAGDGPGALEPMRAPSSELANLVLQAVVSEDPQQLNSFLGSGGSVSEGQRLLVSTFWSAVTGNVEQARDWLADIDVGDGVTRAQLNLVEAAAEGRNANPIEASYGNRDPLALAMGMVLLHQQSQAAIRDGRQARVAAEALSDLVQLELDAPWPADRARLTTWGELLNNQQDRHRLSPLGDWASFDYEVQSGDFLIGIRQKVLAQRPGTLLCTGLIEAVNQLGEYLQPGKVLRIPTTLPNVVVDLESRTLLYRHGDEVLRTWIVGIGRQGHETPVGTYVVGGKQPEPSWMPVGAPALPYGHPENPLGTRWISWDRDGKPTSYGFHGTSDPSGVGGTVSKGCIRMHNEHVEELYELLPTGATIVVQR